jgi:hypothetical protein
MIVKNVYQVEIFVIEECRIIAAITYLGLACVYDVETKFFTLFLKT